MNSLAARAEKALRMIQPLETKLCGDHSMSYRDPAGHVWAFMTHVENVTPEQTKERMAEIAET